MCQKKSFFWHVGGIVSSNRSVVVFWHCLSLLSVMSGALMDAAIAEVGPKAWQVQTLDTPASREMECPEPISFSKFTSEACRPISTNVKSIQRLFDVQEGIEVLSFKAEVPQGSKVDLIW